MSVKYKKNGTFINIPTGGSGSGGSANIWEGTAEELETQQPSIPNESLLLVNNDGMGGVVLDAELSTTSENAIQNKAVATAINSTNSSISELQGSVSTNTSNISSINDTLATVPTLKDTIDTASDTRDADTLEGHAANYFATQTSVTSINDSLNSKVTYKGTNIGYDICVEGLAITYTNGVATYNIQNAENKSVSTIAFAVIGNSTASLSVTGVLVDNTAKTIKIDLSNRSYTGTIATNIMYFVRAQ